ncbi:MAG: hypothetical protein M3376_14415 [Actinomycetota bacterium]|nr:hypothetical protein [Actinomycetota bacterium]
MTALSIRRWLRRHRRHAAVIATVLALVGVIAAHHSGDPTGMHHDGAIGAVAEMCLGVLAAAGAAFIAIGAAGSLLERRRPFLPGSAPGALCVPRVPVARARHGPSAVSILCVCRR